MLQCGDVVVLSNGVPQEYRRCPAIVTKISELHCTVIVLDEQQQVGIGECWPALEDVSLESTMLRMGSEVVVHGMAGARTKHLNGLTGTISEHPREGHPSFIRKPSCPETPHLTVCIRFHDTSAAQSRTALIEPRFLRSFHEVALSTTEILLRHLTPLTVSATTL